MQLFLYKFFTNLRLSKKWLVLFLGPLLAARAISGRYVSEPQDTGHHGAADRYQYIP